MFKTQFSQKESFVGNNNTKNCPAYKPIRGKKERKTEASRKGKKKG